MGGIVNFRRRWAAYSHQTRYNKRVDKSVVFINRRISVTNIIRMNRNWGSIDIPIQEALHSSGGSETKVIPFFRCLCATHSVIPNFYWSSGRGLYSFTPLSFIASVARVNRVFHWCVLCRLLRSRLANEYSQYGRSCFPSVTEFTASRSFVLAVSSPPFQ